MVFYFLILLVGFAVGLMTCIAAELHLKWLFFYVFGILFVAIFFISRDKKKFGLGLFTFFITFFIGKKIISSEYAMITGGPSSIGLFLYDLPLMFLLAYLVMEKVLKRSSSLYLPPVLFPFVIFIVWSGISIINSVKPVLSLIEIFWLVKMAIILVIVPNLIKDRRDLILVMGVLLAGLIVQEMITMSQVYLKKWYTLTGDIAYTSFQTESGSEIFRAGGTVGPHNVQASYYALLIPFTAGLYFTVRKRNVKFIMTIIMLVGILALALTYSRNGYIGLGLGLFVVMVLALQKRLLNARHLIAIAWMIIIACSVGVIMTNGNIIERMKSRASLEYRAEGIKIALNMVAAQPILGVGLNNFSIVMGAREYSPEGLSEFQQTIINGKYFNTVVHNKYLLVASELGIVGLGVFLWMLYIIYSFAYRLLKNKDKFFWGVGAGMMGALVASSFNMLFDIYNSDLLITIFLGSCRAYICYPQNHS